MGTRYTITPAVAFNSSPPPDDGTQVASNLVTYAGVKTKLADPVHVQADAIDGKLVAALDLSARAISSPDTAIASDHWKTLQVTGSTTVTLSSAASMGAGYEVGIFNAGVGVVTVTPGLASDTINGVSASVTVSIKGTKIFRTNQALTGYNVVGGYDPQTVTATTSVVTPSISSVGLGVVPILFTSSSGVVGPATDNTTTSGSPALRWVGIYVAPGGININVTKRKTGDESVTSSTVLQDDDHLTFAIAANEEWVGCVDIDAGANLSTTGAKIAITVPSGAVMNLSGNLSIDSATNSISGRSATSGSAAIATSPGVGTNAFIHMQFWVLNSTNAGNITVQWAQNSSVGSALTFRKGSSLQATRIA